MQHESHELYEDKIILTTYNSAKGLERDYVFLLDSDIYQQIDSQNQDILYVAKTRAKEKMYIVISSENTKHREASEPTQHKVCPSKVAKFLCVGDTEMLMSCFKVKKEQLPFEKLQIANYLSKSDYQPTTENI